MVALEPKWLEPKWLRKWDQVGFGGIRIRRQARTGRSRTERNGEMEKERSEIAIGGGKAEKEQREGKGENREKT